eukprot:scaffold17838_cov28-Tisochrysis_lutea.AAC.4
MRTGPSVQRQVHEHLQSHLYRGCYCCLSARMLNADWNLLAQCALVQQHAHHHRHLGHCLAYTHHAHLHERWAQTVLAGAAARIHTSTQTHTHARASDTHPCTCTSDSWQRLPGGPCTCHCMLVGLENGPTRCGGRARLSRWSFAHLRPGCPPSQPTTAAGTPRLC